MRVGWRSIWYFSVMVYAEEHQKSTDTEMRKKRHHHLPPRIISSLTSALQQIPKQQSRVRFARRRLLANQYEAIINSNCSTMHQ